MEWEIKMLAGHCHLHTLPAFLLAFLVAIPFFRNSLHFLFWQCRQLGRFPARVRQFAGVFPTKLEAGEHKSDSSE